MQHSDDRPKLLLTRKLPDLVEARARRRYDVRLNTDDQLYNSANLLAAMKGMDAALVALTDKFSAPVIEALPDCVRMLATFSVGLDHIDLQAAAKRGLVIANTPDVLTDATAEMAVLLTLGACRRIGEGERMLRGGHWGAWSPTGFLGTGLTGRHVGILGLGRIGQAIAQRLAPFGVHLHYHSRRPVDAPGLTYHATPFDLFGTSQIMIIAAASTPETRHIVNKGHLAAMVPGGILVNIARGDLVDEDAVFAALKSGHLAAAGLDVYQNEPKIDPRWLEFDQVLLSPHLGSATIETRVAMGMRALDNLDDFFNHRRPRDQVVPE
jgi:glyoxylate reductase